MGYFKLTGLVAGVLLLIGSYAVTHTTFAPKDLSCSFEHPSLEHFKKYSTRTIDFEGKKLPVWVANDTFEQQLGLSDTFCLPPGQGLLFEFSQTEVQKFWMKDMNYPIDIIWLDDTLKEVGRVKNADPKNYPDIYSSPQPVKYVLEVNAA